MGRYIALRRRLGACLMLCTLASLARADGNGLHSEFGEVHVERLAIGKTYSLTRLAATPLVLRNTSSKTLSVQLDVVTPAHHELRPGAEALADPSWVRLERRRVELAPRTTFRTDVRVSVPYDPDLAGKTFQVDLVSRVVEKGKLESPGQHHRLVFTVAMDYNDDTEATFSLRWPR